MDGSIHEDEMRNYGAHSEVVGRVLTVCACYFIECEIKKIKVWKQLHTKHMTKTGLINLNKMSIKDMEKVLSKHLKTPTHESPKKRVLIEKII